MPKRITQEDIDHVWHTYESFHGVPKITKEEATKGVHKLLRMAGIKTHQHPDIKFVTGRNYTRWPNTTQLNINLGKDGDWREIAKCCAWRAHCQWDYGLNLKMARRICQDNWLLGALVTPSKPKEKPTKDAVRALKITRLEARLEAWERKVNRAHTAISKINRSLNALRRHQHGNEGTEGTA